MWCCKCDKVTTIPLNISCPPLSSKGKKGWSVCSWIFSWAFLNFFKVTFLYKRLSLFRFGNEYLQTTHILRGKVMFSFHVCLSTWGLLSHEVLEQAVWRLPSLGGKDQVGGRPPAHKEGLVRKDQLQLGCGRIVLPVLDVNKSPPTMCVTCKRLLPRRKVVFCSSWLYTHPGWGAWVSMPAVTIVWWWFQQDLSIQWWCHLQHCCCLYFFENRYLFIVISNSTHTIILVTNFLFIVRYLLSNTPFGLSS